MQTFLLASVKNLFVTAVPKPRRFVFGPFAGIRANLNFRHQTQVCLGLEERELHGWLRRLSQGVKTALDLGANKGYFTMYFLHKTKADRVIAFEPDPEQARLMAGNLALNGWGSSDRLEICPKFVGGRDSDNEVTLDSFIARVEPPCIIKMDVERAEASVLRGARRLNAMPGVRWLIETHSEELEDSCIALLQEAGFRYEIVYNAWWRVVLPEPRKGQNRWLAAWKE